MKCWSFNGPEPSGLESPIRQSEKEADSYCWSFNGPEPGGPESKRQKEADIPWFTWKANRVLFLGLELLHVGTREREREREKE